jgi:hypothetical protein
MRRSPRPCSSNRWNSPARHLTDPERAAAAEVEKLGALLFHHDQLAWQATDAIRDRNFDVAALAPRGWLTDVRPGLPDRVIFVGERAGQKVAVAEVVFDGVPPSVADPGGAPLVGEQSAMFRALELAREQRALACTNARNSVVFPDPAGKGLLVYLMSATEEPQVMVSGGHVRFLIDAAATKIVERLDMTKSCLTMPIAQTKGSSLAGGILTHFTTPLPTEVHVFNSLLHKVPIVVFAPNGTWRVAGGKLERIF